MSSRNGKKYSGLRLLWIPGSRKNHPKGRFSSTNKQVSYSTTQKKNQNWSLGGSKAQQNLLQADPDTTFLDGPSTSGLTSLACATAASGATAATSTTTCLASRNSPDGLSEKSNLYNNHSPTTPNSSTSTAPLISPPQSPLDQNLQLINNSTLPSIPSNTITTTNTMPAKSHQPVPVIITATTTVDIMEENRFSLLAGKDIVTNEFDIYTLPSPPTNNQNSQENLNNSSDSTLSQITPSGSPHKINIESQNGSINDSPVKNKHRNQNNNQGDVNSIESITEDKISEKIPSGELDWIDGLVFQERQNCEILAKSKKKKKKKHAKELDQLDGVPMKENTTDASSSIKEEDDKVVKCLYYTLMCCDCTIS